MTSEFTNTIKNRLEDYVESAVGGITEQDYTIHVGKIIRSKDSDPISSIKTGTMSWQDKNYGRKVPETGAWVEVPFTVRIFSRVDRSVAEENPMDYEAMDYADDLITYLNTKRQDSTEKSSYYIYDIYDLQLERLSRQKIPRNLGGIEVSGTLLCKWQD